MKFSAYAGDLTNDTEHLKKFVSNWFLPEDNICIVGISVNSPKRKVLAQVVTAEELLSVTPEELDGICNSGGEKFNTYITTFPIKEEHNVSLYSRGHKEDIKCLYGVYVDLDVKPGSFDNKQEIYNYLIDLDIEPTIIVDNGASGGVHAYWRFNWDVSFQEEDILEKWWSYLSSKTDRIIDKLDDKTRVLRMPSGIYWSKLSGGKSDLVRVHKITGKTYHPEEIISISKDAFEDRLQRINKTHDHMRMSKEEAKQLAAEIMPEANSKLFPWRTLKAISKIEDIVNATFEWDEILLPYGWTYLRELKDGSNEWARPGRDERSAVTDYIHSSGETSPVMSLLSKSEETGLHDLQEAEIPLTKYQVLLRLKYNDSVKDMLIDLKDRIVNAST